MSTVSSISLQEQEGPSVAQDSRSDASRSSTASISSLSSSCQQRHDDCPPGICRQLGENLFLPKPPILPPPIPPATAVNVAYYDNDFDFNELIEKGEAFEASLLELSSKASQAPPAPLVVENEPWEDFHSTHHSASFFKAKRYLLQEFPSIIDTLRRHPRPVLLELGCGAGAALYPILSALSVIQDSAPLPPLCFALDISPRALSLLTSSPFFSSSSIFPICYDISSPSSPPPSAPSGDATVALLIFTLSAISPDKHALSLARVRGMMSAGGLLCFRDYGVFDLTHLRFPLTQCVQEYVRAPSLVSRTFRRGDGTLSHFFTVDEDLRSTFEKAGFSVKEMRYATVINVNRKEGTTMKRVFVHVLAEAR